MAITLTNSDSLIEDDVTPVSDITSTIYSYYHPGGSSLLVVEVSVIGGAAVALVTFNGNTLTIAEQQTNSDREASIWFLQNPEEVSGDLVVETRGDSYGRRIAVASYSGTKTTGDVINTTTYYNYDVSEGNGLEITPTVDGCLIFDGIVCGDSADIAGFETVIYADDGGTFNGGMLGGCQYYIQPTAATKSMDWIWSGESEAVHVLVAFEPEPEPVANNNQFLLFFN
ncbi:MAG: hypothetical protein JSS91_00755 [Bacteroidetes bacterium]|nr:hypothetical protein [Bacteroidota bacterium]